MRMIIPNNSEFVCQWVADKLGEPRLFKQNAYGMGIVFQDRLIAGVVYHDWTDHNCFISLASISPHWASRLTLQAIFGYPFNQMGVSRVSVIIRGGNRKWRKMLINRFGFVSECKLEDWFGEGLHGYLLRMKREECRWIDERRIGRQRAAV